jgi:hypothetical protein
MGCGGQILVDDLIERPAASTCPPNAPNEPDVRIGIDEHFDVAKVADAGLAEEQDSVDHDDLGRRNDHAAVAPDVAHEVVDWLLDRFARREMRELADEQLPVEGVGVIPVDLPAFGEREVRKVDVVRVHVDERDRFSMQRLRDVARDGRFT